MERETLYSLVLRARRGETAAFEEIVSRFSRRAIATAHFITGDLQVGEEAAQDAFLLAWRKMGELREPERFAGWFGKILARTASRARRSPPLPLTPDLEPAVSPAPAETADLPAAAKALRPKYREVLALRYVEGLSYREIADALGISVSRVKSRLHDGRELLRSRIRSPRKRQ